MTINLSGFIFWILAARLYKPEDVGLASTALSAALFLANVSGLGLGFGLIRFLSGPGEKSRAPINSAFVLSVLASLVLATIFLAGLNLWSAPHRPMKKPGIVTSDRSNFGSMADTTIWKKEPGYH